MPLVPIEEHFVVALPRSSGRLFVADSLRDEWQGRFCYAQTFAQLHEAVLVADKHGALVMPWREAHALEIPD
jgi:hypothetical protein